MIPSTLVDARLEADIIAGVTLEPHRAARLLYVIRPAMFALAEYRELYTALSRLPWPAARWTPDTGWTVNGLTAELEARTLDADRLTNALADAIDHGPLLPFADLALARFTELDRRRRYWLRTKTALAGIEDLATLDHAQSLLRQYAVANPLEAVEDLEAALARMIGEHQ